MRKPLQKLTYAVTIYLSLILSLSLLWGSPLVLVGFYGLISALMLYKWHGVSDLCLYFTGFAFGPLGEMVPAYFGAWTYAEPSYVIPMWLPPLWGIVALGLKKQCDQFRTLR